MRPNSNRPKVIKHCPEGHDMQMTWRTCPACTGQEPELITNFRGNADATVMFVPGDARLGAAAPVVAAAAAPPPPPRPKIKVWQLTVTAGPRKGDAIELGSLPVRIGKSPKAEAGVQVELVADSFMSRDHVLFSPMGEAWLMQDLKSTNGTALNGERTEDSYLRPGDEIRAGGSAFLVEVVEKDAPR